MQEEEGDRAVDQPRFARNNQIAPIQVASYILLYSNETHLCISCFLFLFKRAESNSNETHVFSKHELNFLVSKYFIFLYKKEGGIKFKWNPILLKLHILFSCIIRKEKDQIQMKPISSLSAYFILLYKKEEGTNSNRKKQKKKKESTIEKKSCMFWGVDRIFEEKIKI